MAQSNTQRIVYLDLLRVPATLAVIYIHVNADGLLVMGSQYDWYVAMVGGSLVRWAVPVFVMISGALYLNPQKLITTETVLKRKIPRLLLAYVAWWVIYAAAIVLVWVVIKKEPLQKDWLMPHFHLWFLPMLAGVFFLIPLLRVIASDEKLLRYALVIWLCYLVGSFAFVKEFEQISPLFEMNLVFGYSGYFLLGYYLSTLKTTKRQRTVVYVLGVVGALITIVGAIEMSLHSGTFDDKFYTCLSLHVMLMATALFVLVKDRSINIGKKTEKLIGYMRADLFGIYLTHELWVMVVNKDPIRDMCNHVITLPLICVTVFILSLFTTKLIRKIPYVKTIVE